MSAKQDEENTRGRGRMRANLFLIRSPFQAYLARHLIEQYDIETPLIVFVSRENRAKGWRYFQELRNLSRDAVFLRVEDNRWSVLGQIRHIGKILGWLARYDIARVYLAHYMIWYFRVVAKWSGGRISTFDDGSFNYVYTRQSPQFHPGPRDRTLGRLLGGYSAEQIYEASTEHFAIRKDLDNLFVRNVKEVDLFKKVGGGADQGQTVVFLGQPLEELHDAAFITRYFEMFDEHGDVYFPHPREQERPFETVDTDMIVEEYIAGFGGRVKIYGPMSTAFLTITDLERTCFVDSTKEDHVDLMRRAGCRVVELS